mmetsp:Transcript_13906/g.23069  ORF Transcript_13906/g.23069 Transcript_13906/m.23069 type:complete len:97 (+) Transcript_13906:911-1201(+)
MCGVDRPVAKPVTMSMCQWLKKTKMKVEATAPVSEMQINKLPTTLAAAALRLERKRDRNVQKGRSAVYCTYSSDAKRLKAQSSRRFRPDRAAMKRL